MKKNIIIKAMLTVLVTSGLLISIAADHAHDPAMFERMVAAPTFSEEQHLTKAIYYEGEYIPMIELPVVEITADISTDHLVTAEVIDGKVVPSIRLEEVLITPNREI